MRSNLVGVWILALGISALAAQNPSSQAPQSALQPGVVVRQTCASHPDQSYALYLPSHYSAGKRWPIVYAFDPDARGEAPVGLMKDAAERYGYIVVGSNDSRNGSWKVEGEAAQAMWEDTHARFSLDDRRIYFAGFSGGARVASALAQQCKCAAGVLLDGAGFAGTPPSHDAAFAVYAIVGTYDFNYPELSQLDEKLQQAGFPHMLRHFEGLHQWAPAAELQDALAWFRLLAMKQNLEARDQDFIAHQMEQFSALAHGLEQSGQAYEAWREYRQAVATFDGLADTAALRQAEASLAQRKAVRDGPKREAQEFQQQKQLTGEIYAGFAALRGATTAGNAEAAIPPSAPASPDGRPGSALHGETNAGRSDIFHQTEQQVAELRQRADAAKQDDKMRVYRRALSGVFIGAAEFGDEAMEAKDYAAAKEYFELACDANPDSAGALQALAKARALDSDRKGSLEALRRARQRVKDPAAFSAWLSQEPAFAKLREDPQFRALMNP